MGGTQCSRPSMCSGDGEINVVNITCNGCTVGQDSGLDSDVINAKNSYSSHDMRRSGKEKKPLLKGNESVQDFILPMYNPDVLPGVTSIVNIQKTGPEQRLGIGTIIQGSSHCLQSIEYGGLVDQWNRAHPDKRIQVGDHIVEANGIRNDPKKIRDEWLSSLQVSLKIIAARCVEVELQKPDARAMLGIKTRANSKTHRITRIVKDGLLDTWNMQNPNMAVQVGDYIVEVNGMQGDAEIVRDEWLSKPRCRMSVMAPRGRGMPGLDENLGALLLPGVDAYEKSMYSEPEEEEMDG